MTREPGSDSAHRSPGSGRDISATGQARSVTDGRVFPARTPIDRPIHNDANDDTAKMSNAGLGEASAVTTTPDVAPRTATAVDHVQDAATQTRSDHPSPIPTPTARRRSGPAWSGTMAPQRLTIKHLMQQLRHERYLGERVQILRHRKNILNQTISLAARLHRLHAIVRDGLIEMSTWRDSAIPFKKLLKHTHDLVDMCYSRWNLQLHALDPMETADCSSPAIENPTPRKPLLSSTLQDDLLELLNVLRSNPAYLVRRIKALSHAQLQGLSTLPRFERTNESAISSLPTKARNSLHQRLQTLSRSLQDHTVSFERSHPWHLLLFNVYGTDTSLHDPENLLRISTWSTVLADLFVHYKVGFLALAPMLFDSFASIHDWQIKDDVQLQLMDVLQRGAFLLSPTSDAARAGQNLTNLAHTSEAQSLFADAVLDLLLLCGHHQGGFPPATLQFMSAVLAKLPTQDLQSDLRSYCLNEWFIGRFLRIAVTFPENENMLLNFHVSTAARQQILQPLFRGIADTVFNVLSSDPSHPVAPAASYAVSNMVSALDCVPVKRAYPREEPESPDPVNDQSISICLSEILQLLDALSPQVMHTAPPDRNFVESLRQSFQSQYSYDRFDQLRKGLLNIQEPGTSVKNSHPCDEHWVDFQVDQNGRVRQPTRVDEATPVSVGLPESSLNIVQQACLRLCDPSISPAPYGESSTNYRSDRKNDAALKDQFRDMLDSAGARSDPRSCLFWESALAAFPKHYPKCDLTDDDSPILQPLVRTSKSQQSLYVSDCAQLETEVSRLEDVSSKIRGAMTTSMTRLEDLKMKLWYSTYVLTSKAYEDAKNVSEALMNMAILTPTSPQVQGPSTTPITRPASSRSSTSSAWRQPVNATLGALKARVEHGGPKKLSDEQVLLTQAWLRDTVVENFCTGEERIHRFCMEISSTARAIISESGERAASPVLWCNVLFSNDETYYNLNALGVSSAPASTRPASVSSEPYAPSLRSSRPGPNGYYPSRTSIREGVSSTTGRMGGPGSWATRSDRDRDLSHMDPFFTTGMWSPGPAYSVTTTDSVSTFWSPRPSNPRSMTSASLYSRPASMFNEAISHHFSESSREDTEVLDLLRHKLVCLLLSDLGCVVWSRGSETDAWLHTVHDDAEIVQHRRMMESLFGDEFSRSLSSTRHRPELQRRGSLPLPQKGSRPVPEGEAPTTPQDEVDRALRYDVALQELLGKMRSHVDPRKKLQAVEDFHDISVKQLLAMNQSRSTTHAETCSVHRRHSLDAAATHRHAHARDMQSASSSDLTESPTEVQILGQIRTNLMAFKPKTLFRDLQYIAALVPQELSNRTARGEAVLRMGIAALAYKDDVCQSMVTVADKLISKDTIRRLGPVDPLETSIKRAAELWMIAAREGNAVAQRELGLLYLSHPHSIPVLTYPLTMASKVFRSEPQWRDGSEEQVSGSSLYLALHWMTLASENGDAVATRKMAEQEATISIR